jgi:hypothetical protein
MNSLQPNTGKRTDPGVTWRTNGRGPDGKRVPYSCCFRCREKKQRAALLLWSSLPQCLLFKQRLEDQCDQGQQRQQGCYGESARQIVFLK